MFKIMYKYICYLLLLIFIAGCSSNKADDQKTDKKEKSTPVKISKIVTKPFISKVALTSVLEPIQKVEIVSKINGDIEEVFFDIGDKVSKDDSLVKIDDELYNAVYKQASAAYDLASSSLDRLQILFDKNLLSSQDLESAKSNEAAAKAAFTSAKLNLDYTDIKTPISGIVAEKYIENGNTVAQGTKIAVIMDVSKIKVLVGVNEFDINKIQKANKAYLEVDSLSNMTFMGKISAKGLSASAQGNTFPLEITFDNPSFILKPGMMAKVKINKEYIPKSIFILQDTVLEREDGKFVYKVVDKKAILTKVKLGETYDDYVQILSGLSEGDLLVVKGQQNLVNGELLDIY